ncbi:hypothetical protein V8E36_007389 [Tilletia maclaganii]
MLPSPSTHSSRPTRTWTAAEALGLHHHQQQGVQSIFSSTWAAITGTRTAGRRRRAAASPAAAVRRRRSSSDDDADDDPTSSLMEADKDDDRALHDRHSSSSSSNFSARGSALVLDRATLILVATCILWYSTSALNANTSQALLKSKKVALHPSTGAVVPPNLDEHAAAAAAISDAAPHPATAAAAKQPALFPHPLTLTLIQFLFVNAGAYLCCSPTLMGPHRRMGVLVWPTWTTLWRVGQLSVFHVVGHLCTSAAISRVPVSTVQTIKAISPLVTVVVYSSLFNVSYPLKTYISLLPLSLGVMLACSGFDLSGDDVLGFSAALASTVVVVGQNIYSKKLLGGAGGQGEGKMDKMNIMFFSSATSCALLIPSFLFQELPKMLSTRASAPLQPGQAFSILFLLTANGISHFAQNVCAFSVLNLVSPVTYSIANLFKRVFVIMLAIIWFGQTVTFLQAIGIFFTFAGLYLYNESKPGKVDEKIQRRERQLQLHLPLPNERPLAEADLRAAVGPTAVGNGHLAYPPPSSGGGYEGPSSSIYNSTTTTTASIHHDALSARHRMLAGSGGPQPIRIPSSLQHQAAIGPIQGAGLYVLNNNNSNRAVSPPQDEGVNVNVGPPPLLRRSPTPPAYAVPSAGLNASGPGRPLEEGDGPVGGTAADATSDQSVEAPGLKVVGGSGGGRLLPTPPDSTKGALDLDV